MGSVGIFVIVLIVLEYVRLVLQLPEYIAPPMVRMANAVMDKQGIASAAASTAGPVVAGIVAALLAALAIRAARFARNPDGSDQPGFERLRRFPIVILAPISILLFGVDLHAELALASAAALFAGLPNVVRRDAAGIDVALLANWVHDTIAPTVAMVMVIEYLGAHERGIGHLVLEAVYMLDTALAFGLISSLIGAVLFVEDFSRAVARQN